MNYRACNATRKWEFMLQFRPMNEEQLAEASLQYMRDHQSELRQKYTDSDYFPSSQKPFTIFMAGAPGAGKTEISKWLCRIFLQEDPPMPVVRIDPDEIRDELPQHIYIGGNAHLFQRAVSFAVEKLYDTAHKKSQNILLDGTFASLVVGLKNVKRAIEKGRMVGILYVYQDPIKSWELTQKREAVEGRKILKKDFIDSYFLSKENVNKAKEEFGQAIRLHVLIKDHDSVGKEKFEFNVRNVDSYINDKYSKESLEELLKDVQ